MLDGKKTKLFWCGLFIVILGAYLLIGRVYSAIVSYQSYQNYLNLFATHGTHLPFDSTTYLTYLIIWTIIFVVAYSVLIAIGVYVAEMGIKPSEEQTAGADQTESALVK